MPYARGSRFVCCCNRVALDRLLLRRVSSVTAIQRTIRPRDDVATLTATTHSTGDDSEYLIVQQVQQLVTTASSGGVSCPRKVLPWRKNLRSFGILRPKHSSATTWYGRTSDSSGSIVNSQRPRELAHTSHTPTGYRSKVGGGILKLQGLTLGPRKDMQ